ncbi:PIN domain-containing protein [Streptomyces sp. NPDC020472]|uniref:PIN domain-containing protein n=1 Tax=Streptomyces sp. NPDC020472 TaxID=3365075 RepID=UPI00378E2053
MVVPDTNFFIKHDRKFEDIDFFENLSPGVTFVSVVVPMVVVDELDRLKESRDRQVRRRVGYSLAVLDRLLDSDALVGEAKVELLSDDPGHVRLPDENDEIVDRATAAHSVAGGAGAAGHLRHRTGRRGCVRGRGGWRRHRGCPRGRDGRGPMRNLRPRQEARVHSRTHPLQ